MPTYDKMRTILEKENIEDGKIKLKIKHTYEVNKSEYISKGLGLNQENIELAKLIALLHDIGRYKKCAKEYLEKSI